MVKPLVIYHFPCNDGFAAAYAFWRMHPEWEYHPANYGQEPPDVKGREVYIVDFSYKQDIMLQLIDEAESITVLDHHRSAQKELEPLLQKGLIKGTFDMDHSGAWLAYKYITPKANTNDNVEHFFAFIQDRDLWQFKYDETNLVHYGLQAYPFDFNIWDKLANNPEIVIKDGHAIKRYVENKLADIVENVEMAEIAGHIVPMVNAPHFLASELGNLMAQQFPFGVTYYKAKNGIVKYSMRSKDQVDVSEIAEQYGGGGHKNAAGFIIKED